MSSQAAAVVASVLFGAAIFAVLLALVWVLKLVFCDDAREARRYNAIEAKHTAGAVAERAARTFSGLLKEAGPQEAGPPWDPDGSGQWWTQHAPMPHRVEILTGPHQILRYKGELTEEELAAVTERFIELADRPALALPAGTGQFPMLPDDEPPQLAPDDTGVIPVVHAELGVATTGEFVEIGFAPAEAAIAEAWAALTPCDCENRDHEVIP